MRPCCNRATPALAVALAALLAALPALAAPPARLYKVGMASRAFVPKPPYNWRGSRTHALLTTVWYPAAATAKERRLMIGRPHDPQFDAGSAAPGAKLVAAPRHFPLVLLSHGTGGTAMQLAWLGEFLAARGYIAAAVNHPGNDALAPYTVPGFALWWLRARDLSVVLDHLLADPEFGPRIDRRRIGAAGFSLGGYTMLELAGGVNDPQAVLDVCNAPRTRHACDTPEFPGLVGKVNALLKSNPAFAAAFARGGRSYRDPRIRAVFAIAPALGMAFSPASLAKIAIPVEIVAGAADSVAPPPANARYFARHIRGAKLVMLPNVMHYTFLDPCTATGKRELPPLFCGDRPGVNRVQVHDRVAAMAVRFFNLKLNR